MSRTYIEEPRISWYRSPVDKDLLAQLMVRDDRRGWMQTLAHLGLFFCTGLICWTAFDNVSAANWLWSVPLFLLSLFVHGTMGPFMGLIAIHELQHRTVFKTRRLNEIFEVVYAFISWSDYLWYQKSHVQQDLSTCHEDYDGEVALPVRFSLRRRQFWLSMLAVYPPAIWARLKVVWRHARGEIHGDWYQHLFPPTNLAARTKHRNWARTLLLGHGLLALVFVISGNPFLILVFNFGTFYCGWLGFLCGVTQHYGLNPNIPDFRQNTRTFTCSWLPAFYYWNMQYHLEHHMYPAVPFFNLGKLREAIKDDLPPAPHGLVNTWKEMLALRKRTLADPAYRFYPMGEPGNQAGNASMLREAQGN